MISCASSRSPCFSIHPWSLISMQILLDMMHCIWFFAWMALTSFTFLCAFESQRQMKDVYVQSLFKWINTKPRFHVRYLGLWSLDRTLHQRLVSLSLFEFLDGLPTPTPLYCRQICSIHRLVSNKDVKYDIQIGSDWPQMGQICDFLISFILLAQLIWFLTIYIPISKDRNSLKNCSIYQISFLEV